MVLARDHTRSAGTGKNNFRLLSAGQYLLGFKKIYGQEGDLRVVPDIGFGLSQQVEVSTVKGTVRFLKTVYFQAEFVKGICAIDRKNTFLYVHIRMQTYQKCFVFTRRKRKIAAALVPQVIQLLDRMHQLCHFMETVPILVVQCTI